jgi:hypothetical protein
VIDDFFVAVGLQQNEFVVAALCALIGAFIMSRFTMSLGTLTYPVNFCVLLAGAVIANLLMKNVEMPLDYSLQRPLIVSMAGMAVAALISLLVLSRDVLRG